MIVYVKVYGTIIARDLSLVASRLYRMAVTRPWTHHVPLAETLTARRYTVSDDHVQLTSRNGVQTDKYQSCSVYSFAGQNRPIRELG